MIRFSTTRRMAASAAVALVLVSAGCTSQDEIIDKVLEDSGAEVGLGEVPDGFPSDVPLPDGGVTLESGVAAGGTFALRYGLTDPAAVVASYRTSMETAGFTIESDFDNLGGAGDNVGFVASNAEWNVTASAFGDQPADGLYLAIAVTPAT